MRSTGILRVTRPDVRVLIIPALVLGFLVPAADPAHAALPATATTVASSANPSSWTAPVTFTVTVTSESATPVGTAEVLADGVPFAAPVTLDANGTATVTSASLGAGPHAVTARFLPASGAGIAPSGTAAPLTQVVEQAASTTTLATAPNPAAAGAPVTLTATVAATAPANGVPTGTVSFADGTTTLGTANLVGGTATLAVSTLSRVRTR